MWLIVVLAFIATIGFYRRAKEIGIYPGKIASVPFVGAGLTLALAYLAQIWIAKFLENTNTSDTTKFWIAQTFDWFLVLSYSFYIKRTWDALSAALRPANEGGN